MFEKYKNKNISIPGQSATEQSQAKELGQLANRLGHHMGRVIKVAKRDDGWIACYATMSSTDWPSIFPDPLAFLDLRRSLGLMIDAFEPPAPDATEDAAVRDLAQRLVEWDEIIDYVFVAHRQDGYHITVVSEGEALVQEWPPMSFDKVRDEFSAKMSVSFDVDDTYLGTGRDYGKY